MNAPQRRRALRKMQRDFPVGSKAATRLWSEVVVIDHALFPLEVLVEAPNGDRSWVNPAKLRKIK